MERLPALPPEDPIDKLIAQALDKQVPVESLERLLAMREKYMAEQALKAFNQAMTEFQHECPIIKKTKGVSTDAGILAYRYAPIDSIVSQVRSLIYKYGFSYHISTDVVNGNVIVHCTVKHVLGHSEITPYGPIPLGQQTRVMNDSQVVSAAFTYAKRYAFCNAFGIMTGDEDTDGRYVKPAMITEDTISQLLELVDIAGLTLAVVLKRYKVSTYKELTEQQGQDALVQTQKYIDRMKGNDDIQS